MVNQISVRLISHTVNPAETVAVAGKGCYSPMPASDIVLDPKDVDHTLEVIHPSCYEHAVFTFSISGISRVTSHQLVRHRMASYSQQSQRYVKPKDLDKDMLFDYVMPESVSEDSPSKDQYEWAMKVINKVYRQLLGWGCPEEDARYILPNACTTALTVTMNARELQHFCGLRRCTRAQWEIRELADKMARAAEKACPELFRHFSLGPQCERLGYCPEHKGCGRVPTLQNCRKGIFVAPKISKEDAEKLLEQVKKAMDDSTPMPIFQTPVKETNDSVLDGLRNWNDLNKTYTVQLGKGIIGEVSKDSTPAYVPGRIAGETINEWTKHNTIPIATEEDLAQQKEREEDASAVAKSVVEKSAPCCPNCGTPLATELRMMDSDLRGRMGDSKYTIGCPRCQVWYSSSVSTEAALKRFIECWDIVDEGDEE